MLVMGGAQKRVPHDLPVSDSHLISCILFILDTVMVFNFTSSVMVNFSFCNFMLYWMFSVLTLTMRSLVGFSLVVFDQ